MKPYFVRLVPSSELDEKPRSEVNTRAILVVGILLILLILLSIVFYAIQQPDTGRVVIDLAVAFLTWIIGRTSGENAATQASIKN